MEGLCELHRSDVNAENRKRENTMDTKTIIDTLITNRTQADVERVWELAAKGFAAMTADEQAEWQPRRRKYARNV